MGSEDAQVPCAEVMNLLEKVAIEIVPPAQSESGFYSRYFPKGWWPATYSRSQTSESCPGKKVVQDDHFEANPLANMPRGLVNVAGSERCYFHIQVAPPLQTILEIRFEGVAYQYKVLPFGLSLAPRTFMRCMDAALTPL